MTDLSAEFQALAAYRPTHKVRFVTAASLFDGHDAAINIMRRIIQATGGLVHRIAGLEPAGLSACRQANLSPAGRPSHQRRNTSRKLSRDCPQ